MALKIGACLLTAALATLPSACTPAVETQSDAAAPYRIVYNARVDSEADDYEVFRMNLDGSEKRNLSNDPAVDWAYHADEHRVYMVSDRDDEKRKYRLYEMDTREGAVRRITDFRVRDSWMGTRNHGEQLVISSSKDGQPDLYLIDNRGNVLRRLTEDEAYDNDPAFSPDGTQVVWRSKRSGETDELWIMDLDSGDARQLTHFPQDDPAFGEHGYHAGPPTWEPNRNVISYCSKRDGAERIFTIRPDGTGLEQLTPDGRVACYHDWSPDGRFLVFDSPGDSENWDVYLLDLETEETFRLTHDPIDEQGPVFVRR